MRLATYLKEMYCERSSQMYNTTCGNEFNFNVSLIFPSRYLDVIDVTSWPRVRSGYWQAAIVFVTAALVNAPKWFEFRYIEIPDNASVLAGDHEFEGDSAG